MVGRTGGGGRACGGGGYSGGARHRQTVKNAAAAGSRSSSSSTCAYVPGNDDPGYDIWYNYMPMDFRWLIALRRAKESCPKDPDGLTCRRAMELLVDYPQEKLKKYGLPTERVYSESALLFPLKLPLKLKDPMCACNMWKSLLERCLKDNSHFDARWKCVPFEGFVQDHCPSDNST